MSCLVVKLGGHALDSLDPDSPVLVDLAHDIELLRSHATNVVVVHGGGPQIAALLHSVGIESRFHEGLRVTDRLTMGYTAMALGQVNVLITAALNRAGLASSGLSGADDSLFCATSVGEPWDRVGGVPKVRGNLVTTLWSVGVTPVVSPVAVDQNGELLNCNADTAAGALAGSLGADVLILLSDVDQLRSTPDDPATAMVSLTRTEVRELLDSGAAREGMRPKMVAALDALSAGAKRVLLANGARSHVLRDALAGRIPTTEVVR